MNHPLHRSLLGSVLKLSTVLALAWSGAAGAQTFTQGVTDNFTLPTEPVSPSPGLQTWVAANYSIPGIRQFDEQGADRYFATTFSNLTTGGRICGATLRMTVRSGGSNDSMGLWFVNPSGAFAAPGWGESLTNLGIPWLSTGVVALNLASLPGTGTNLLPTLNAQGYLDVIVQDDSAVDSATLVITRCRTDVFIRDIPSDVGVEPGSYGSTPIWMSPDIRVCQNAGCPGNENPEFGQTNFVYVKLNNVGTPPFPTPAPTSGTLKVYYTASGGAAVWSTSWTLINTVAVSIPVGITEVQVPWTSVPAPGHYCLLAVWEGPTDPISFPLLPGSNTLVSTAQNNNLAWRNVNVVNLSPLRPAASFDFRVLNVLAERSSRLELEVRPAAGQASFIERGQVLLKLDDALWAKWSRRGTGFEIVGEGLVRITDLEGARLTDLVLAPGAEAHATVTFQADVGDQTETFEMQVVQHSESAATGDKVVEQGGVSYAITLGRDVKK